MDRLSGLSLVHTCITPIDLSIGGPPPPGLLMFGRARRKRRDREIAGRLYGEVVGQARLPAFYADGGVPDTVDGRFEMVVLHTYLVVSRLMSGGEEPRRIGQVLFDTMITDMDRSLREMGVGDLSVGKKVRAMGEAYYGRSRAYDAALAGDDAPLGEALRRNVYGTLDQDDGGTDARIAQMVAYVTSSVRVLEAQSMEALTSGEVRFAAIPETTTGGA